MEAVLGKEGLKLGKCKKRVVCLSET